MAPFSAKMKMTRNMSALPLRSPNQPRISSDVKLEKMAFSLSEDQYKTVILWLKELERHDLRRKNMKWRPLTGVKEK